jgi:uncharacterized protein YbaA (DUF1428 family)
MAYYDGFVIPVPCASKDKFLAHAQIADAILIEYGARRVVECWADDVARGKVTDFYRAVDARDDEAVAFSWIEWPDKDTRNQAFAAIMNPDAPDPRMAPANNPIPFDGKRMIFGGFSPLATEGDHSAFPYVQGFITPAPTAKREAYAAMALDGWGMVRDFGALGVMEAWGEDVPHGQVTDFYRGVNATEDERVVFSYVIWPSREVCQEAARKMAEMEMPEGLEIPFDAMRMVYGGFEPILDLRA